MKIYEWPIKLTHQHDHIRMQEQYLAILSDFTDVAKNLKYKIPQTESGEIDFSKISVAYMFQWLTSERIKCSHEHQEEKGPEDGLQV